MPFWAWKLTSLVFEIGEDSLFVVLGLQDGLYVDKAGCVIRDGQQFGQRTAHCGDFEEKMRISLDSSNGCDGLDFFMFAQRLDTR